MSMFQKKRVLLLGAHGFIGQRLLQRLCQACADVTAIVFSSSDQLVDLKYEVIKADLANTSSITFLSSMLFDYVFNLSGYIDHTPYFKGGRSVINTHYIGLLNLLEVLDRSQLKGFVQVGSSDEYGGLSSPLSESIREAPISPYSCAKLAATQLIQMLAKTENFPGVVLRFFLVYGPGQGIGRFLPQVIQGCLNNSIFPTSQGEQLRDFCYVEDIVDAMLLAATMSSAQGEVINIASGVPVTIREMIEKIHFLVGQGQPEYGQIPYRPGENMSLFAEVSKAKSILNWVANTPLEVGLQKTIGFYKQNMVKNTFNS